MSLSKRFPLFDLPLLLLEQVILPLDPKDLLFLALSSEKARQLLRMFSLVEYLDIDVQSWAVIFSFRLKSGKPMKWISKIVSKYCKSEESVISVFELDDMRMRLCVINSAVACELPKEHFSDWTQRIGYLFQSIFSCQRIRKLGAGMVGWGDEEVFFHMDRITSCDEFSFIVYNEDHLLEILEKMDVKRKITLWPSREVDPNLEWLNNEKIRKIPSLELSYVRDLDCSPFLSLENENLHFEECKVKESAVNAYLKKWMNGEFTKRRTLRVVSCPGREFDDTVLNGLTPEPVKTWEKLGKPRHVQFSDKIYLNPTPSSASPFYIDLLKNCHGQFATVLRTFQDFYFVSWDHPLPPINILKELKLCESSEWPFPIIIEMSDFSD